MHMAAVACAALDVTQSVQVYKLTQIVVVMQPPPQFPTPEARTKSEKGRRITLGGDTVRIP